IEVAGNVAPRVRSRKPWTVWRAVRWASAVFGLLLLALIGFAAYLLVRLQGQIYHPLPPTPTAMAAIVAPQPTARPGQPSPTALPSPIPDHLNTLPPGRFNILVLGTDKRPNDTVHYARSDTILLANVDTISKTVRIMSIPRDMIVDIPGYG